MSCLVLCRSPSNVGYSMMRLVSVHNESDNNDSDENDNIVQVNNMQVAAKGDENDFERVEMHMPIMSMLSANIHILMRIKATTGLI